jgi:hypothetical protein
MWGYARKSNIFMNKFDTNKLNTISLEISEIKYECKIWQIKKYHKTGGLISFIGKYGHGSLGSNDAKYIQWKIEEFCDLSWPIHLDGLVVDFSKLDYEWGDDLDGFPSHKQSKFPVIFVIREEQCESFEWPIGGEFLRFNLNLALYELDEMLRTGKSNRFIDNI